MNLQEEEKAEKARWFCYFSDARGTKDGAGGILGNAEVWDGQAHGYSANGRRVFCQPILVDFVVHQRFRSRSSPFKEKSRRNTNRRFHSILLESDIGPGFTFLHYDFSTMILASPAYISPNFTAPRSTKPGEISQFPSSSGWIQLTCEKMAGIHPQAAHASQGILSTKPQLNPILALLQTLSVASYDPDDLRQRNQRMGEMATVACERGVL